MKKTIADKIEKLLAAISVTRSETGNRAMTEGDGEEPHFEKNPDRYYNMKLPARLAELLRPKRKPGFR